MLRDREGVTSGAGSPLLEGLGMMVANSKSMHELRAELEAMVLVVS